jgi:hypothetical protein
VAEAEDDGMSLPRRISPRALIVLSLLAWHPIRFAYGSDDPSDSGRGLYGSCGLNCLFIVLKSHAVDVSFAALRGVLNPSKDGESSVADLERAAKSLGLEPVSARVDFSVLSRVPCPAIVQLRSRSPQSSASHYVVLMGLHRDGVITIDAPASATLHPYGEFQADWTGVVVAFPRGEAERSAFLSHLGSGIGWRTWVVGLASAGLLGVVGWLIVRRGPSPAVAGSIRAAGQTG